MTSAWSVSMISLYRVHRWHAMHLSRSMVMTGLSGVALSWGL